MKKTIAAVVLFSLVLIGVSVLQAQDKAPEVADTFEINSPADKFKDGKKTKVPPASKLVTLSHKKHAGLGKGCNECHHNMKDNNDTKNANKCSTQDCHGAEAKGEGNKCLSLKDAMHENCYKGCHKTDKDAIAKNAPSKCNECHAKP